MFAFLDIETTGLNSEKCQVLEVYFTYLDKPLTQLISTPIKVLNERGEHFILQDHNLNLDSFSPGVFDMHMRNGLIHEVMVKRQLDEPPWYSEITRPILASIKTLMKLNGNRPLTLVGSSVHFDLYFLAAKIPALVPCFSHRVLDLSSLKIFYDLPRSSENDAHRAKTDVYRDIKFLKRLLNKKILRRKAL